MNKARGANLNDEKRILKSTDSEKLLLTSSGEMSMSSKAERKKFAAGLPTISAFTSHANYRAEIMSRKKLGSE